MTTLGGPDRFLGVPERALYDARPTTVVDKRIVTSSIDRFISKPPNSTKTGTLLTVYIIQNYPSQAPKKTPDMTRIIHVKALGIEAISVKIAFFSRTAPGYKC